MQKKNSPVYCVGCEDKDVLVLSKKLVSQQTPASVKVEDFISASLINSDHQSSSKPKATDYAYYSDKILRTQPFLKNDQSSKSISNDFLNTFEILKTKIIWATEEIVTSTNVHYTTDLCEMIKAASEAISSLKTIGE